MCARRKELPVPQREEIVASFEDGTLHNCDFGHADHLFVIWSLVRSHGTLGGLARFEAGIKKVTAAAGVPEKYHATVTHALAILVGERVAGSPDASWEDFVAGNGELLEWPSPILASLYSAEMLDSPAAREHFMLPGFGVE